MVERAVWLCVTEEPDEDFEEGDEVVGGRVGEEEARRRVGRGGEEVVEVGLGCEHDGAEDRECDIGRSEGTSVDEEAGEGRVERVWKEEGADDVCVGDIAVDEAEIEAELQLVDEADELRGREGVGGGVWIGCPEGREMGGGS